MPTVMLLGASVSQLLAIRYARSAGMRVVAVDGDPDAVGFAEVDEVEAFDFRDVTRVVAAGRRHGVDAVIAVCSDRSVPVAAETAERLGLPGIGVEVARAMTDKQAMRDRLAAARVTQPRFAIVDSFDAAARALGEVGLPAVLKPADSGGQRGVFCLERSEQLAVLLPQTLGFSRSGRAVLEQYLEGDELNAIAVVRDGQVRLLTLSDRLRPPGLGFGVGWIHRFPSTLHPDSLERAGAAAVRAVTALGLRDGIAFPQLLVVDGEPHVVEVGARVPAGQMADLVYHGVGVDLLEIAFTQALGRPVTDGQLEGGEPRPTVIRFFTAQPGILPTGLVTEIAGLDAVRASPGVLDADVYLRVGEIIRPVQVDADRRGYVIATGTDTREAMQAASDASRKLRVRTDLTDVSQPVAT